MSFFGKKLYPFSPYTIALGPLYVERVFDSLLTLQGAKEVVRMPAAERFERYLEYLRKEVDLAIPEQYTLIQFYKGHFCQQLAKHNPQQEQARHLQEKALCYYQNYLELPMFSNESRYYAQWQTGILQDSLNYPWSMVEESLSKAHAIDPFRGEPVKKLIAHHMRNKEWNCAYAYSELATKEYFNKNPAAKKRWFVEFDAYDWNVLNKHLTICYKLGYLDEFIKTLADLKTYELHHLDEFNKSDIRLIHSLERLFHKPNAVFATAF